MTGATAERTACVWCPDWPVAAARARARELRAVPVAVVERGPHGLVVRSASSEARATGVTPGLRRREAEGRCPGLVVLDTDAHVEARAFELVARAVEQFTPRLGLVEPGLLVFPTRGPARYFGGEETLARLVLDAVVAAGVADVSVGIADGLFAARLAAQHAARPAARTSDPSRVEVVDPGGSAEFLAGWPVGALGDPELAGLLERLGLRTLGAFARLPPAAVLARFGPHGARLHRRAQGLVDRAPAVPSPPPELTETAELDPPAVHVDTAAFVAKGLAERLLDRLAARGLACARVTIEAETEHGERRSRCWRHEGALTPAALAARVRWQLEGWLTRPDVGAGVGEDVDDEATAGIALLRLVPDEVIAASGRQLGFWGGDPAAADRAGRAMARVQGMLGHPAVTTAVLQGGRTPGEQVRWVPWGDPREPVRPPGPWPGRLPGPAPARFLEPPLTAELFDDQGDRIVVSGRGEPSGVPSWLRCELLPAGEGEVSQWAGPWVHDNRWWDRTSRRRCVYWQLTVDGIVVLVATRGRRAELVALRD